METAQSTTENLYYSNINNTRELKPAGYPADSYTNPNDYAAKTNGSGQKIGPAMILKVMAGDKFNVRVNSWYKTYGASPGTPVSPLNDLLSILTNSIGGITSTHGGVTTAELQNSGVLTPGVTNFLNGQSYNSARPKAFINWIFLDEQFKYYAGSVEQVGNNEEFKTHTFNDVPINKSGWLYVYVSNETPNIDVFFDNLQVTHIRGSLLETNEFYPFGLLMKNLSYRSMKNGYAENKRMFNDGTELGSKEFSDGSGLEMYETAFRGYDPQIGRFWQVDMLSESNWEWTPYNFALNNPIRFNDPLGLKEGDPNDPKVLPNVTIYSLPKGFWAKQRMYYDVMDYLSSRKASIDQIVQPNLREMMYRFDGITKHREVVNEMTHQSDPIICGIFLAPIAFVEGGFILAESQLSALLADAPHILKYLSNKKYNQAIRTVLNYLAKRMPVRNLKDFERLGKILNEMQKTRDLGNDLKTLNEVKKLVEKIFNLKI